MVRQHPRSLDVADVEGDLASSIGDNRAGPAIGALQLVEVLPDHDHFHVGREIADAVFDRLKPTQRGGFVKQQEGARHGYGALGARHGDQRTADHYPQKSAIDRQLFLGHHEVDRAHLQIQILEPETRAARHHAGRLVDRPLACGFVHR